MSETNRLTFEVNLSEERAEARHFWRRAHERGEIVPKNYEDRP
jgi:hypothetical protein